jgi:adhesin transport system membrane fusion protein
MSRHEPPRLGSVVIWVSALTLGVFLAWVNWAELDQITRASGQVIASSRNQVIQAAEGGILVELPVQEGMTVHKGQMLARFDRSSAEASVQGSEVKIASLKTTIARLNAEVSGGEPAFPIEVAPYGDLKTSQLALFRQRKAALNEEIAALKQSQSLVKAELDMNLPLLEQGDVSKAEILRLKRQAAEVEAQIANRRNQYQQEAQTDLAKALEDLAGVVQIRAQRREALDVTEVTAPMDGVVRNIQLTTIGGVARPGDEIMQIVPLNDVLLVEVKVSPADIAFLRTGLPASVKLDAYDYTVYGALPGEVSYISPDSLKEAVQGEERPYFRVQIKARADSFSGKGHGRIEMQPGMTATAEIKTGSQTVWRYLTKPITKTMHESLGER